MDTNTTPFQWLRGFLLNEMRMSHVYQPVMIRELLRRGGTASAEVIARALLAEDRAQVDYYRLIVRNMVGRVLTKNRGIVARDQDSYQLDGFETLSPAEVSELEAVCEQRIASYLEKREDPWSHRRKSTGYVSGTIRYEILKKARYRCELCGVSAEHKALEVDHIVPRNHGGSDDTHNLQALCYSCNAMKQDRDATDFRGMARRYDDREKGCVFCDIPDKRIIARNELCIAFRDLYPVTPLHSLIIPRRHVIDYFGLFQPERNAVSQLLDELRSRICAEDPSVTGFNIGMNAGKSAGQTVFHCHVHLIPRRESDVANPEGGVRGVIPGKQHYR
jgi:diadenosine tetraphosphate (Ap4A) HIT family hydrolase/5-methylcytosine-specific restriction endonuclease McrA